MFLTIEHTRNTSKDGLKDLRRPCRRSPPREVMRGMRASSSASVRKAMNRHGLPGHVWHVGHACPDPSKSSARDEEDYGWNLFAQHAVDNSNLGHCLVSCAEAEHVGAEHVRCTQTSECVRSCARRE